MSLTKDPLTGESLNFSSAADRDASQKAEKNKATSYDVPIVVKDTGTGKQISGATSLSTNKSLREALESSSNGKIYYNTKTGEYSSSGSITISLNKKTGKITLDAPQYVLDRDITQKYIDNLKTVAKNYQLDKDYKYPSQEDDASEGDEITSEELIQSYQDDLNNYKDQFKALDDFEKETENKTGIKLNDTQAQTALSGNYEAISNAADTTRVVLPTTEIANFFKGLETYQEVNGVATAEYGDLMENGYSRAKMSDDDIIALQAQVVSALQNANKDTDPNEYAQNYAFATFMKEINATTDFWSGAGDVAEQSFQVFNHVGQGTAELLSLANDIPVINLSVKAVNSILSGFFKLTSGKSLTDTLEYEGTEITNENIWKDFILKSSYESEETYKEKAEALGVSTAVMSIGDFAWDFLSIAAGAFGVVKSIGAGVAKVAAKLEAKGVAKGVAKLEGKQTAKDVAKMYTKNAASSANAAFSDLKVLSTGELTASVAKTITSSDNLLSGAKLAILASGAKNASNAFLAAAKLLSSKPVTTSINFVADTVVSATIMDPELTREVILGSDDPEETSAEVMRQFIENGVFWGAGAALGRGLKTLGETTKGQAISHNLSRVMNQISTNAGDFKINFKMRLAKVDSEDELIGKIQAKSEKKGEVMERDQNLRQLKKALAQSGRVNWLGKTNDEVMAQLNEVREYNVAIREAYNLFTKHAQGPKSYIRQWTDKNTNLMFGQAYDDAIHIRGRLIKADAEAGYKAIDKGLSQEGINCVNSISRLADIQSYERITTQEARAAGRKLTKEEYKTIAAGRTESKWLKDNISKYIGKNEELAATVNDYVDACRQASRGLMDIVSSPMGPSGKVMLESRAEIESLRSSGLYGEEGRNWMMTGRVKEEDPFLDPDTQRVSIGSSKLKQREFGSTKDFEDPLEVINRRMVAYAYEADRRSIVVVCANTNAVFTISPEDMKFYIEQKVDLDKIAEQDYKVLGNYIGSVTSGNFAAMFKDYAKNKLKISNAQSSIKAKTTRLEKAKAGEIGKTTIANQKVYIANTPDDMVYNALSGKYGFNNNGDLSVAEDGFSNWLKSLPDNTKTYINREVKKVVGSYDGKKISELDFNNFQEYLRISDDATSNIAHSVVANDKELRNSQAISDFVEKQHQEYVVAQKEADLQLAKENYNALIKEIEETKLTKDDIYFVIDKQVDDMVDSLYSNKSLSGEGLNAVLRNAGESDEVAQAYIALKMMVEAEKSSDFANQLKNACRDAFDSVYKGTAVKPETSRKVSDMMAKMVGTRLKTKMEFYQNQLVQRGSKLVNRTELDEEIRKEMKDIEDEFGVPADKEKSVLSQINARKNEIGEQIKDDNIIHVGFDGDGNPTMVMVSAATNDLVTRVPKKDNPTIVDDVLYITSKLFRANVTGLNLKSWISQTARDIPSIFVGTGNFVATKNGFTKMDTLLGPRAENELQSIVRYPFLDSAEVKAATESGDYLTGKTITQAEEAYAESVVPGATETQSRRQIEESTERQTGVKGGIQKAGRFIDNIMQKETIGNTNLPNPAHLNEWREQKMRLGAYRGAFAKARRMGYTLEQSRIIAEDIMNHSATNFSWKMYHLQNIQRTVPYLGAAVNGTKSFWHLASLDPVGVFGRLGGGICAPTAFLVGQSLATEENREVYQNIQEYEKKDNLVFVVDGEKITIPMPQEMSAFFNTVRIAVEESYGAADGSFWQLMTNNLVSLSPIDLTGFTQEDARLTGDYGFWQRTNRGVCRLASQLLPPSIKGTIGATTGYDLYTGKKIDTSYSYVDYETGETVYMDYKSSESAKAISSLIGGWLTPAQASSLLSGLFGTSEPAIISWLGQLAVKGKEGEDLSASTILSTIAESEVTKLGSVFTGEVYDKSKTAWSQSVSHLYDLKEEMLNSDYYQSINDSISKAQDAGDTEKLKKYIAERQDYIDEYRNKVKTTVDNLIDKYGSSSFGRKKYAAVLSLMNLGETTGSAGTAYARELSDEEYNTNKQEAVASMYRLGFTSAQDSSILGYYATSRTGEAYFAYNHPVAILNARNTIFNAADVHQANISDLLEANDITRSAMFGEDYQNAKSNTSALKTYKAKWNKKVVKALQNYIDRYGYQAVLNDTSTIDMLDQYIFVNNPYKAKDYIKSLFKEEDED